ncbi:T9SS type B sorting domain-containing protein [Lutibacter oricola]|nr:gliding motility-associated C-terminal domain-containing protein [Lutibacter oricola]
MFTLTSVFAQFGVGGADNNNGDVRLVYLNQNHIEALSATGTTNEISVQSLKGAPQQLHSLRVQVQLPPGVLYTASSILITDNNAGVGTFVLAEDDITDLNAPIFSIFNNGNETDIWDAGDYVNFTFERTANCDAVTYKEAGNSFKDNVEITYEKTLVGPQTATDINPLIGNYDLLAASLSIEAITPVNGIVGGGNVHTRNVSDINGGNASISQGQHIVDVGSSILNYTLSYNGNLLTPDAGSSTATHLVYNYDLNVAPYNVATTDEDGDGLFEGGEKLTFEESFELTDCVDTTINHITQWTCQASQITTGNVLFGVQSPNLSITKNVNSINLGQTNHVKLTITNNGTGAAAWAQDFLFNLGLGRNGEVGGTTYTTNPHTGPEAYDTRSFTNFTLGNAQVAFTPVPWASNRGGTVPTVSGTWGSTLTIAPDTFGTDPDDLGTGLEDIDGDGFFDDIAPGGSVVIEFDYTPDPTSKMNCSIGSKQFMYWQHVYVDALVKDQCNTPRPTVGDDLGYNNFMRDRGVATTFEQDTDILEGVPFNVTLQPKMFSNFTHNGHAFFNNNTDSEFEVSIIAPRGISVVGFDTGTMPPGFSQVIDPSDSYVPGVDNGTGTNIITYTTTDLSHASGYYSGNFPFPLVMDCTELLFGGTQTVINISYETKLRLTGGATNPLLEYDIHCGDFEPIIEHSCNPPCQGPNITGLDAYRITAGWADPSMTSKVDLTATNIDGSPMYELDKYLAGDEMMVETTGFMSNLESDNLYFVQTYITDGTAGTGVDDIEFLRGTVKINGGTEIPFDNVSHPPVITGSATNHSLRYNLSFALASNLNDTDTFEVNFVYRFNTDKPYNQNYHILAGFRGRYQVEETLTGTTSGLANDNDNDGVANETISCFDWGDQVGYLKPRNHPYGSYNETFKYCEEPKLSLYNDYIQENAGKLHPGEYRPVSMIQSTVLTIPDGLSISAIDQYTNMGTFSLSAGQLDISPALGTVGVNTYTITPNRANGYIDMDQRSGGSYRMHVTVKGSCELQEGGSPLPAVEATTIVQHLAYTDTPIPSQLLTRTPSVNLDYLKPTYIIQPMISSTVVGHSPEAEFDINVANTSAIGGDVGFNWIYVPQTTNITVTGADDITAPLSPVALNVVEINGNSYIEIGGLNVSQSKNIRVKATYTSCTDIPVDFSLGWNCDAYPTDYSSVTAACYDNSTQLTLQPALAQIQQSITAQPMGAVNMCDPFVVDVEYLSAQPGTVVDAVASVQVFNGVAALDVNQVQVEYPSGSGNWEDVTSSVVTGTDTYSVNITHSALTPFGGIPGTGAVGATPSDRSANVRFTLQTTCDYVSNSALSFIVNGDRTCGEPSVGNGSRSLTNGIQVNGLSATYDALATITLPGLADPNGGHIDGCSAQETINILTTISELPAVPGATTGANDYGRVNLPTGVTYVGGSFVNVGVNVVTLVSSTDSELVIQYPAGLGDTEITEFNFDIIPDAGYCAENAEVSFTNYVDQTPGGTCGGTACGTSLISTGSTRENLDINKAAVAINLDSALASVSFANELITASFTIDNSSAVDVTPPSVIKAFYDANGDGVYDIGDLELGSHDITATIPAGGSVTESIQFTATPSQACNILLVMNVDDNPCICLPASVDMGSPSVLEGVAGSDIPVCETYDSVELGAVSNPDYTYSWTGASAVEEAYLDNLNTAQPNFTYSGASLASVTTFSYTVTITRPGGCTSVDTVDVTVNPSPEAPVIDSSEVDVCSNEYMTVTFGNSLAANEVIKVWKNAALTTEANAPNTSGIWTSTELFPAGTGTLYATVENTVTGCRSDVLLIPYTSTDCVTDLVTTKVVDVASPSVGDTIIYTITVRNDGPSGDQEVTLTDVLPSGVSYVSDDSSGAYTDSTGEWLIGDLANGATATLNITATVDTSAAASSVTNSTTAAAGTYTDTTDTTGDILDATIVVADLVILARDDDFTGTPVNGYEGNPTLGNILPNNGLGADSLNGTPVAIGLVTVSFPVAPTVDGGAIPAGSLAPLVDPATGAVSVPAGTPAGDYTIPYTICEIANPTNCTSASVFVRVTAAVILAEDDDYTSTPVDGAVGDSNVGNVLVDNGANADTLNGEQAELDEVDITVTAAATSINGGPVPSLDATTGVVSVPAGTPAGTYTIDYNLCEELNPTNCDPARVTVVVEEATIVATDDPFGPINSIDGGLTTSVLDNDTLNGSSINPSDITLTPGTAPTPTDGSITMNADGTISIAPGTTPGVYSYPYTICENLNTVSPPTPGNCETAIATITVVPATIEAQDDDFSSTPVNGLEGESLVGNILTSDTGDGVDTLNGSQALASDVTITTGTMMFDDGTGAVPAMGTVPVVDTATGNVSVPAGTPAGTYTIDYTICDDLTPNPPPPGNCDTATITVVVEAAVINAEDDDYSSTPVDGLVGGLVPGANVLDDDTLNNVGGITTADVAITSTPTGPLTVNADGTVSVAANTPSGSYMIDYTICEVLNPTNCDTATVTVVVEATIEATDDDFSGSPVLGYLGGAVGNVLDNSLMPSGDDTVNGVVATVAAVDITIDTPAVSIGGAPVPVLDPVTGDVSVPAGTPAGTYTIAYTICEDSTPTNCDDATVTVVVEADPIDAVDDAPASPVNGLEGEVGVVNVFDNDTLNGAPVVPSDVTLTLVTADPEGALTLNGDGTVDVAPGTPAGTYELDYEICEVLNPTNCSIATVTVIVEAAEILAEDDDYSASPVNSLDGSSNVGNVLSDNGVGADTLNGVPVDIDAVDLTVTTPAVPLTPGATVPEIDVTTGTVSVPAGTPAGVYTITYSICEELNPTNCDDALVTVVVEPSEILAQDDDFSSSPVNGLEGESLVGNILTSDTGDGVDTLNGVQALASDVTITVDTPAVSIGGAPVPEVDPATGNVSVPAGTPAGTYTIDYTICDNLTPTPPGNCDSAVVTVVVEAAPIVAEDDVIAGGNGLDGTPDAGNILGDNDNGYDTLNGVATDVSEVVIDVSDTSMLFDDGTGAVPVTGIVPLIDESTGIVSIPPGTPAGDYIVDYTICELLNPTNCDPATVTITVDAAPIVAEDDLIDGGNGLDGTPVAGNVLSDNGDGEDTLNGVPTDITEVDITVDTPATPINPGDPVPSLDPVTGDVSVPAGTPAGDYEIEYTICEQLNPTNCDTAVVTIAVDVPVIDAVDDDYSSSPVNGLDGEPNVGNALDNDTLNGVSVVLSDVAITIDTPAASIAGAPVPLLDPVTGIVSVPVGTPADTYTIEYTICENLNPTNCDTAIITVEVEAPVIDAVDDAPASPVNGLEGEVGVVNVFDNDTLNGAPVVPSDVTLTLVTADPEGALTLNGDGTVDVAPGTPAGTYELDYEICEVLNPTNCSIATVTVIVEAAEILAEDDDYSASPVNSLDGSSNVGNVLSDNGVGADTLNGVPVDIDAVDLTVTTPAVPLTPGATVPEIDVTTGTVSVPAGTPAGVYTITYSICEELNPTNCDDALVTVVVEPAPIDAVNDLVTDIDGYNGDPDVGNVLSDNGSGSDTLNGVPVLIDDVTIAVVTPAVPVTPGAPVPVIDPVTGIISVPPGTPGGSYDIEYQICEELNPTNCDTAIVTVEVNESADLTLLKEVDVATPNVGDTVNFTITLTNNGLNDATGVNVVDQLPSGYTFVSATASVGTYDAFTGSWNVGSVVATMNETLVISAIVNATGDYTNTAEVTSVDQEDPTSTPGNNDPSEDDYDEATTTPVAIADLVTTKVVDQTTANVGDVVQFTLTVVNNGPSPATGVMLADQLPAGLTYVSHIATGGTVNTYSDTSGVWSIGDVAINGSAVLILNAEVDAAQAGNNITNVTTPAAGNEADPTTDGDDLEETVYVTSADLAVTKTVDDATPNEGNVITYVIEVVNNGPDTATGVSLVDNLPVGVTYVSSTTAYGAFNSGSGEWMIGTLSSGATASLTIMASIDDGTVGATITNTTSPVLSDQEDPDPSNNVGSVSVVPVAVIDLSLTKTIVDDVTAPLVGDQITFEIRVINEGPTTATGVQVTELIPSGYDFVNYSSTIGTYDPPTGLWNIGNVEVGNTAVLLVDVLVLESGEYENCAEIIAANEDDVDSTPGNGDATEDDYDCAATVPVAELDLAIVKTVVDGNMTPNVGDVITFEIQLTNNGPLDGTEVTVLDNLLPLSYTFVNYSSTVGTYDEITGIWNVGEIESNDTEVLLIDVIVEADGDATSYTNCALVAGVHQVDIDATNDESCITLAPVQVADLELTKDVDNLEPVAETNVDFTINLMNVGPSTATGVQVLDLLPSGYDFVSATTTVGTYDATTGLWNVGTVLNGDTETLVVTAYVKPYGDWLNQAEVTAANELDIDSTPGNGDIYEDDMAEIATAPIVLLTIPEGFTPDGDGINDVFEIEHLEVLYPNFSMEIVNRYGNIVYEYKHNGNENTTPTWWDGYSDGRWNLSSDMLPAGTYFYTIYFNNDERKPQTGWIYLRK